MKTFFRLSLCIACISALLALAACGSTKQEVVLEPATPSVSGVKMWVSDVSNNTGDLFDVDVIGSMWGALEASLYERGLLWNGEAGVRPLEVRAEIVKYQKGNFFLRNVLPHWGKSTLEARCVVMDGDRVIASLDTSRTITLGQGSFKTNAWREVFKLAAEDFLNSIVAKL